MKHREIIGALDGFMAWDCGCRSSGIFDAMLRDRVKGLLLRLDAEEDERRKRLSSLIWKWLDNYKRDVYGLEDHEHAMKWMLEFLGRDDFCGL